MMMAPDREEERTGKAMVTAQVRVTAQAKARTATALTVMVVKVRMVVMVPWKGVSVAMARWGTRTG